MCDLSMQALKAYRFTVAKQAPMIHLSQLVMFLLAMLLGTVNCQLAMLDGGEMNKQDNYLKDDLNCYREIEVQLLRLLLLFQDDCPHLQSRHHGACRCCQAATVL
jgi:hypothetical protein